jgi:hypothetical protein
MYGLAAVGFLVIAEGMWGDLLSRFGNRWRSMYMKGGAVGEAAVTEAMTWSWESLVAAQETLGREVRRAYDEPTDPAPTSRHGLLHGRVAGAIEAHHALKAFTMVDAIVEHAQAVRLILDPTEFDLPPWLEGESLPQT